MLIAAPAAFDAAPDRTTAANIVGAMLSRWHLLAVIAPLVLLARDHRRGLPSTLRVVVLASAIILAVAQIGVDMKIGAIRAGSPVAISALAPDDPVRKKFGMLHGVSSLLMLLQVVAAGIAVGETARGRGGDTSPRS